MDNLSNEEYNALAARSFADYLLGKRTDYLPFRDAETGESVKPPTAGQKKKAHTWANSLINPHS